MGDQDNKDKKDKKDNKVDPQTSDLVAQAAAETVRADKAENELSTLQKQYSEVRGERDSLRERLDEKEKELEARADEPVEKYKEQVKALVAENERLQKERNDAVAPEKIRELVKQRVDLETSAKAVFGDDARFDELNDRDLQIKVIEKLRGTSVDPKESDDYVRARFDSAIEGFQAGSAALDRVRAKAADRNHEIEARKDEKTARQKFLERQDNAWKGEENAKA